VPEHIPAPFEGLRVADFSHFIAGPFCAMMLGDLGAEVIKIKKPNGGDDFRRLRPPVTDQESADRQVQSAPLGLAGDTSKKQKKPKPAGKTRMTDELKDKQNQQPAPNPNSGAPPATPSGQTSPQQPQQ